MWNADEDLGQSLFTSGINSIETNTLQFLLPAFFFFSTSFFARKAWTAACDTPLSFDLPSELLVATSFLSCCLFFKKKKNKEIIPDNL